MYNEQQSPINLTNPIHCDFGKDGLDLKLKKSAIGEFEPDHGSFNFGGDERQFIVLNRKKFHLVQFHFHHPSEHWVDGKQQTMELHIVHQNTDDGTRAVLGVFIEPSPSAKTTPSLVSHIQAYFANKGPSSKPPVPTNPLEWLPSDVSQYYRYEGSLTTKDFDENVSWVVFRHPLLLPLKDLNDLIKSYRHPARLPQALNRRYLLANWK